LEWALWQVENLSNEHNLVVDAFAGSGTTGVACVRLGRKFIGIELEPKYYEIAIKRIRAEQERFPLFEKSTKKEPQQLPGFDQ
jgi:DNA modification methylase